MKKYIVVTVLVFGFLLSFSFVRANESYAQCVAEENYLNGAPTIIWANPSIDLKLAIDRKKVQCNALSDAPTPAPVYPSDNMSLSSYDLSYVSNYSGRRIGLEWLQKPVGSFPYTQLSNGELFILDVSTMIATPEDADSASYQFNVACAVSPSSGCVLWVQLPFTPTPIITPTPVPTPAPTPTPVPLDYSKCSSASSPLCSPANPAMPLSQTYTTYAQCNFVARSDEQQGFDPLTLKQVAGSVPGGTEPLATAQANDNTFMAKCNTLPDAPGNSSQSSTSSNSSTPPSPGSGLTSSATPVSTPTLSCPVPTDTTSLQNQITTLQTTNNSLTAQIATLEAQLTAAGLTYSTTPPVVIAGCNNRTTGYSITTGQSCVGNTPIVTKTTSAKKVMTKK